MQQSVTVKLTIAVVSVLLTLGFLELTLRLAFPQSEMLQGETALFEYHPSFGWQFAPNTQATVTIPDGHETEVGINEFAMRDRGHAVAKSRSTRRVAVLGDSFLVGFGVEYEKLVTTRLEQQFLNRTEVLNFGVSGYGPLQEYLLLQERVLQFKPDVVVMMVYLGNDLADLVDDGGFISGYQRPSRERRANWRPRHREPTRSVTSAARVLSVHDA